MARLTSLACVVFGFFSVTATSLAASGSNDAPCPFNYPTFLNTTGSGNGLIATVALSKNPAINNKALQLITIDKTGTKGVQFVGLKADDSSPVLLSNLKNGGWYSQARNDENQLYDLGPTGYLNLHDEQNGTQRYTVAFANASSQSTKVDLTWMLEAPNLTGTYGLYHQTPTETANGFIICTDSEVNGITFTQLFYYTYKSEPYTYPNCQFIGVRATVGPNILNGACNIGGYTAGGD